MANMLDTLRAKRDAGEISTSSTGAKIAGEGHYVVQLTNAEWGKNRNGDAEQGKLSSETNLKISWFYDKAYVRSQKLNIP